MESHNISNANSKIFIKPNFPEFGVKFQNINKILEQMATVYARLMNQYKHKYQTVISSRFHKQDEDGQTTDQLELFNNLNNNHNLTDTDIVNINI